MAHPHSRLWLALAPSLAVVGLAAAGALTRPLWLDETYSLAATRDLDVALRASGGSMGLYYLFIAVWGQVSASAAWLRLPSVLAMAGAVGAMVVLVSRQHGRDVARTTAMGLVSSYVVVRYAQEARSYAFVCLLVVGAWSALDRGVDHPDADRAWRIHRACCLALPLLHGLGAVQILVQAIALVVAGVRGRSMRRASVGWGLGVAALLGNLMVGAGRSGDWLPPLDMSQAFNLLTALTTPVPLIGGVLVGLTVLATALVARRAREAAPGLDRFRLVMPLCWGPGAIGLLLAISVVRPSYLARYAVPATFGVVLVLILAAIDVDGRRHRRAGQRAPLASVIAIVLIGVGAVIAVAEPGPAWPSAVEIVAEGARPGDAIAFPTADARLPFDAAWTAAGHAGGPHAIASAHSLGAVRRELEPPTLPLLLEESMGQPRLWLVSQRYLHVPNLDLRHHPTIMSTFRSERTWDLSDGITVTLLQRRPDAG